MSATSPARLCPKRNVEPTTTAAHAAAASTEMSEKRLRRQRRDAIVERDEEALVEAGRSRKGRAAPAAWRSAAARSLDANATPDDSQNVSTPLRQPGLAQLRSVRRAISRCPRWKPSKNPIARTSGRSPSRVEIVTYFASHEHLARRQQRAERFADADQRPRLVAHEDVASRRALGQRHHAPGAKVGRFAQVQHDRRKRNDVLGRDQRALRDRRRSRRASAPRRARTVPTLRAPARPCAPGMPIASPRSWQSVRTYVPSLQAMRSRARVSARFELDAQQGQPVDRDRARARVRPSSLRVRVRRAAAGRDARAEYIGGICAIAADESPQRRFQALGPIGGHVARSRPFRRARPASSSSARARACMRSSCADRRAAESTASPCRSRSAARPPPADRAYRDGPPSGAGRRRRARKCGARARPRAPSSARRLKEVDEPDHTSRRRSLQAFGPAPLRRRRTRRPTARRRSSRRRGSVRRRRDAAPQPAR